ncbi:Prophage integrase IntS [Labrys miyagiensis]
MSDGGGLHLLVTPQGGKLWRLSYRFDGKQKQLALGKYPERSLANARTDRDAAKRLLASGIDPSSQKKLDRLTGATSRATTFEAIAREVVDKMRREGRADATINKTEWLLDLAYPDIGDRPISEISAAEILASLRKVESRGRYESAQRLRSVVGSVFRYAIATARAENDPTYALRGALTAPQVKHRAAITTSKKFGELIRSLDAFEGQSTTLAALRLMAYLFPRPGELRAAEWSEFDLETAIWTIPATRMKMRREHASPLPEQAIAILCELRKLTGHSKFAFPSIRTNQRPISENTLNAALRRLGWTADEATAHGFRSSASTILNESGLWSADAIERQLAHIEPDPIRRAYSRGVHWDERVRMMSWWANQIDLLKG